MKLLILKGLPASGKSTFAKEFCHKNKDWIRVNRDDLRNMRGDYWIPKQEDLITHMEDQCIFAALAGGYNVILDATNLNQDRNKERVKQLRMVFPDLIVEYKYFEVSRDECVKRDLKRENSVGAEVIDRMYNQYIKEPLEKYKGSDKNPPAYIFDVDGTLAEMTDRGPYDWKNVGKDKLKVATQHVLCALQDQGNKIIIFTGRDGECEAETKIWLRQNHISYDHFDIRPAGNTEKDSIIKKRMFDKIKDEYNILGVFDDRDQVVEMWRDLGLTCFQVDYGNF